MEMSLVYYVTVSVLFYTNFVVSVRTSSDRSKESRGESRIVFPDTPRSIEENQEIPLELIRRLNEVSNITELFENFIEPEPEDVHLRLALRMNSEDVERSAVLIPKMAKCMPESRTVPLKPDKATATFYYPSCTRVNRCGGCCSHHLLSCQPVESEILHVSVAVTEYRGGNHLQYKGKKVVEVEQHTKCRCDCKIRPEDCSRYQKYSREKCRCECANTDEEKKCYEEGPKKLWNKDNCSCICREEQECSSGYYYDQFTCTCIPQRPRKTQQPSFIYNVN